ncbi:MAG: membrane-bound lytic murein transglycosylase MltF [Campylobacterota bacterium]|nr:membrane-bound lytic murein transglycosylase MltF [Campylobacterota bacterium]
MPKINSDLLFKIFLFLLFIGLAFISGWISHSSLSQKSEKPSILKQIKKTKKLKVVLLNSPSTYYIGADGSKGFEYDLLNAYAKHLGVSLDIEVANTVSEAIKLSQNPEVHITSSALAKTKQRRDKFNFGPSYFEVHEQVICNRGMIRSRNFPRDVEGLKGLKITVGDGTSYSETIKALQNDGYDINMSVTSEFSTEELLQMVSSHEIDCTVADSNIYSINQRYYPEIASAFAISGREQLAWVLAKDSKELEADIYTWLNEFNQSGKLTALKDHYYSYALFFNYYDTTMFYKRVKSRLPKYEKYFKKYANQYGFAWELIAAQSYQESHWNPRAKSFTGVRGLMMLTQHTAKLLGVKNRLSPKQSIRGGVRHLNQMMKNVPKEIVGEDRIKFALASYNVGLGHIYDARRLAKKMNLNQNIWSDLKKVLPLLAQKRYYKTLKHGYARGNEPVRYVESIYDYKNILQNNNIKDEL